MANFIPEDKIQEILERVSIQDVVSRYVSLKSQGKNLVGLCPFHSEDTPSFFVNPAKGLFYCFGCGVGGNTINFMMKIENFSFVEAVEFLASQAGILLSNNKLNRQVDNEKNKLIKINLLAQKFFQQILWKSPEGEKAIEYLKKRDISEKAILEFGIGFSANSWDALYKYMSNKKINPSDLFKLGLINERQGGNGYYDRFRGRLMFPIYNQSNTVVGFGGRVIDDNNGGPKYLNSPETKLFQKSRLLYGINLAYDEIRRNDFVILVEGYMDVIATHQRGIKNTVASLGTAFSEEQAKIIKRYTNNVIIAYDSDQAGQEAALRSLSVLAENGCNVKILSLPNGMDPDDYIKKLGSEKFIQSVHEESIPWIEYKINFAIERNNIETPEGKKKVIEFVLSDLAKIKSIIEREYFIRLLVKKLGVTEQALTMEINKFKNDSINRNKKVEERNNSKESLLSANHTLYQAEREILRYLLNNPEQVNWFHENLGVNTLLNNKSKNLVRSITNYLANYCKQNEFNFSKFHMQLSEEQQSYVSELITKEDNKLSVTDCFLILKNNWYKQQIESVRREIALAEELEQNEVVDALVINLMELQKEWKKLKTKQHSNPNGRGDNDEGY